MIYERGYFDEKYAKKEGFKRCVYCLKYPATIYYTTKWFKLNRIYHCLKCYDNTEN